MPYVRDNFLPAGVRRRWTEMQARAARWSADVAGTRAPGPIDGPPRRRCSRPGDGRAAAITEAPYEVPACARSRSTGTSTSRSGRVLYSVPTAVPGQPPTSASPALVSCSSAASWLKSIPARAGGRLHRPRGPARQRRSLPHADPGLVARDARWHRPGQRRLRRPAARDNDLPGPDAPGPPASRPGPPHGAAAGRDRLRAARGRRPVTAPTASPPEKATETPLRRRGRQPRGAAARPRSRTIRLPDPATSSSPRIDRGGRHLMTTAMRDATSPDLRATLRELKLVQHARHPAGPPHPGPPAEHDPRWTSSSRPGRRDHPPRVHVRLPADPAAGFETGSAWTWDSTAAVRYDQLPPPEPRLACGASTAAPRCPAATARSAMVNTAPFVPCGVSNSPGWSRSAWIRRPLRRPVVT